MKKNNKKLCGYQTTNRAKHNLKVHLILVCKYRKKLLVQGVEDNMKNVIRDIEVHISVYLDTQNGFTWTPR